MNGTMALLNDFEPDKNRNGLFMSHRALCVGQE